jgi:hypothetical protein
MEPIFSSKKEILSILTDGSFITPFERKEI